MITPKLKIKYPNLQILEYSKKIKMFFHKTKRKTTYRQVLIGTICIIAVFVYLAFNGYFGVLNNNNSSEISENQSDESYKLEDILPAFKANDESIVRHIHYTLKYNEAHEQAEWIAYSLEADKINGNASRKNDKFYADPMVKTKSAEWYDYKNSGYTRGHLVAAADLKYSEEAQAETFLMSNISPQIARFNDGIWRILEEKARYWAKKEKQVWVITGPVLQNGLKKIGQKTQISVPEKFYKIIADLTEPEIKIIAFIMPQEFTDKSIRSYVVSVDEIEKLTGIDFFPKLADELENRLESGISFAGWD